MASIKIKFLTAFVVMLTISTESRTQDNFEFKESVLRLQRLFESDSSEFHFSCSGIDRLFIEKIKALSDTLPYFPYTTNEAPYVKRLPIQSKKTKKTRKTTTASESTTFLADNKEDWRSGDHVPIGTENLPTRRYLFGITNKSWTAIFYWHNNAGWHLHVVLTDTIRITSFVPIEKSDIIKKLDYAGQLGNVKNYRLNDILDIKSATYLNNKLMTDMGDVF